MTLDPETNKLSVVITANPGDDGEDIGGTGTMLMVQELVEKGYTVTVSKNGDNYKLTGTTATDKATLMSLIPTSNGASTTLTVTIDNGMGSKVTSTVEISIDIKA